MRKKIMLLAFALAGSAAWSTLYAQVSLVVHQVNGETKEVALDGLRTLQFTKNGFDLTEKNGIVLPFSFADVRKLVFASTTTGVDEVSAAAPADLKVKVNDRLLKVEGWTPGMPAALSVYAVSGACVYQAAPWNGEEVSLAGWPVGVYLLKVNQVTLKFILR